MKITIIGSGDIWSEANSACYLIDDNIIIDMPNGTYKALKRGKLKHNDIENVLFTHFHGDHYFDIPFHFLGKSQDKRKNNFINIYTSKNGIKKIKKLLKLAFPNSVLKIKNKVNINYIDDKSFNINEYKVNKVPVKHSAMPYCYAYVFQSNNFKVGFTGDTRLCRRVKYLASVCDYLFCDCTYREGNLKHMGIDTILYLAKKNKKCKFVVTHMSDKTRKEIKKVKEKNIIIAEDMMKIEI